MEAWELGPSLGQEVWGTWGQVSQSRMFGGHKSHVPKTGKPGEVRIMFPKTQNLGDMGFICI